MKPIKLHFEGLFGKTGTYDFRDTLGGLTVLTDVDITILYAAVRFALFGEGQGDSVTKVDFTLSVKEKEYLVERCHDLYGEDGKVATLYGEGKTVLVEGDGEVTEALKDLTKIGIGLFEKVFLLPKEDIAAALSAPESGKALLGNFLNRDVTAEALAGEYAELQAGEAELLGQMDEIQEVDKKEITDQKEETKRFAKKKEKAENAYRVASEEWVRLVSYEKADAELTHYREQKEIIEGKRTTVEESAMRLSEEKAERLKTAYLAELNARLNHEQNVEEEAKKRAERAEKAALSAEKERNLETLAKTYFAQQSAETERRDNIINVLKKAGQEDDVAAIHCSVDELYAGFAEKIRETEGELGEIEEKIKDKEVRAEDLLQKKKSLYLSAENRNAVSEGSVLETRLQILDRRAKRLNEELAANERAEKTLSENFRALEEKEKRFSERQKQIEDKVRGNYPTFKDAINADAYYKQTLYSKHLAVSMQEVELRAVVEKIGAVRKVNEGYRTKMERLEERKKEVSLHRKKLTDRLDAVEDKLRDLMTRNRLRDLSDEAEYGSRCPICDGFVTVKKELPVRDTSALQDQVAQLKSEIEKDSAALNEAMNSIGQYQAAEKVSAQYLASLNETKEAKEKLIRDVLAEYHAADTPELFAKVRLAVEKSNNMTAMIDKYHIASAEISRIKGVRSGMKEELSRLKLAIEKGKEELEATVSEMQQSLDRYEKLQSFFNGENASDLLEKLFIVTSEYERTVQSEEKNAAELAALRQRQNELEVLLISLKGRTMPLMRNGKESDYLEVVANASADVHRAMLRELGKDALSEGRKVSVEDMERAMEEYIASIRDTVAVSELPEVGNAGNSSVTLRAVLKSIGAPVTVETDELVLAETVLEIYYEGDEKGAANFLRIGECCNLEMEKYQDAIEKQEEKKARLEKTEKDLIAAKEAYEKALEKESELIENAEKMAASNRTLTALQERLTYATETQELMDGDTLSADKLFERIFREANLKVQALSSDRYDLDFNEEGIVCIRNLATGEVIKDEKMSKEEKTLKTLALTLTYADSLLKISGGRFLPVLYWSEGETDEQCLDVLNRYSEMMPVAVCPEEEGKFFRELGKVGA